MCGSGWMVVVGIGEVVVCELIVCYGFVCWVEVVGINSFDVVMFVGEL